MGVAVGVGGDRGRVELAQGVGGGEEDAQEEGLQARGDGGGLQDVGEAGGEVGGGVEGEVLFNISCQFTLCAVSFVGTVVVTYLSIPLTVGAPCR